jgi:hypothetical protein
LITMRGSPVQLCKGSARANNGPCR